MWIKDFDRSAQTLMVTQLCLIPPGLGGIWLKLNSPLQLLSYTCPNFQVRLGSFCPSCARSLVSVWGKETERRRRRRWRQWTDVTVSRRRSPQTHTLSLCESRTTPASLNVWVPCRAPVGAWRDSRVYDSTLCFLTYARPLLRESVGVCVCV